MAGVDFSVKVTINKSFYEKLGLAPSNTFEKSLDSAVERVLYEAENVIKREVPRPGHSRSKTGYIPTGNLQRSIHPKKEYMQGDLLSNVPYWVYVQYGTSKMPANPFITRTKDKVVPKLRNYLRRELKKNGVIE